MSEGCSAGSWMLAKSAASSEQMERSGLHVIASDAREVSLR